MNVFKNLQNAFTYKSKSFAKEINSELNNYYSYDNSYFYNIGRPIWMDRDYKAFATEAYVKNVIAHRAIHMIAQSAASVPFKLYKRTKNNKIPVEIHPMLQLLCRPNPMYSGRELLESIYTYKLINGNAFVLAIGPNGGAPKELIALRPDRVNVIAGANFIAQGYRYSVNNKAVDYKIDPLTGRSAILHLKNFHPLSDWYGLSSIEAAAYSIDQHNQAGAWNQALLQNGARPSGAIVVKNAEGKPATISAAQFDKLKQMIDETFCGAQNAGKPILLSGGLEWKEMSISPKDMDFIAAKHSAARDIALAFGMPPQLLGIPGDNTYSNLAEARVAFWEQTVVPLVHSTVEHINHWLTPYFGGDMWLTYDLDNIPALAAKRDAMWDRVEKCSFMTINEKRAAVGLAPLENDIYSLNLKHW